MLYASPMDIFFKDYDELEDWLEGMKTLEEFWKQTSIFDFPVPANEDETRADIIAGKVTEETALSVLKGFARSFIGQQLNLGYTIEAPINIRVH